MAKLNSVHYLNGIYEDAAADLSQCLENEGYNPYDQYEVGLQTLVDNLGYPRPVIERVMALEAALYVRPISVRQGSAEEGNIKYVGTPV